MTTPNWIAATAGQPPLAAQVNQFLGTHAITYVYSGTSFSSQTTAGSGGANSNGTWIAQSFTTGASTRSLGRVRFTLGYTGSPNPMTLSVYASAGSAPTGSPLASTVVPTPYLTAAGGSVSLPLPALLSPSTQYWLVIQAVGDASDFYTWSKSNQTSGAATSANGTAWTAQVYGLIYTCFDQTATASLAHTWEDAGSRWTTWAENGNSQPTSLQEYTVGQGAGQYAYSSRSMSYVSGSLTAVA
jgi:hypothetical protein